MMLGTILNRGAILLTGCFLGTATLVPNAMMSDNGSTLATTCAIIGLSASALFVIGGIAGCFLGTWKALLPGLGMQILPFVISAAISTLFPGKLQ